MWTERPISFKSSYSSFKKEVLKKHKYYDAPTMPTAEDICALNSLYGNLLSEKPEVCNKIIQDFAQQYLDVKIKNLGLSSPSYTCDEL